MKNTIKANRQAIEADFETAIMDLAERIADDEEISVGNAIDYAIERTDKLNNEDLFEVLQANVFEALWFWIEKCPADLREELDLIFKDVAAKKYGYHFPVIAPAIRRAA